MKAKVSLISVLYGILFVVVFVIVAGTIIVFVTRTARPGTNLRSADPSPRSVEDGMATYTELGQIRAITAQNQDRQQTTIILQPWFSYEDNGTAFKEELSGKRKKIRSIITDYFFSQTHEQLVDGGEGRVKTDLLNLVNSELTMGKILEIYFEEYLFLE